MSDDIPEVGEDWFRRARLRMPAELIDYSNTTLDVLHEVVMGAHCKPGWVFGLKRDSETGGLCLVITVPGPDSHGSGTLLVVQHWHPVPLVTYNRATWLRWVFERCRGVENHELGEWFRLGDERPFQPLHGPGEDPYTVREYRPEVDFLTTQDGSVRKPLGRLPHDC